MNPDEDVVLNIGADTTDVERKLSALQATVKHAFESGNASVRKYGIQLDKIVEKMEKQRNIMRQLASQQFENPEYTKITKEVANLEKAWNKVNAELDKMFEKGAYGEEAYETMALQAEKLYAELQKALAVKEQMEKEGTNVIAGKDTEQYVNAARAFNREWKQAGIVIQTMNEAKAAVDKTTDSVNKTNNALDRTEKEAREAGTEIRNFGKQGNSAIRNLATRIKDGIIRRLREGKKETANFGNESEFSFKKALKFVIRYGIGMASLFRVYRRLRVLTKEALQNMGKVIPEVGQQLVDLSNHVLQLKNSLATVAQPLLNQFLPAIHAVINALVSAMNALANFFAMLTGQKFIYKAAKGNKTLADSISGAGKAAKEAKEEIAEYDKLIVLDQPNDGSGGGGGGGAADDAVGTWEKVDGYMTHFIQDVQRIWSVFQQAWREKGESVIEAFKYAWESAIQFVTDVWHTFVAVFTDGTGLAWVESILGVFESILKTVGDIANAMDTAWNKDNAGYKLIKEIFNMFTSINGLVSAIIKSIGEALGSDVGQSVLGQLLTLATNLAGTIKAFVDNFKNAWQKDDTGTGILEGILSIFDTILTHINDMVEATKEWAKQLDIESVLTKTKDFIDKIKPSIDAIMELLSKLYQEIVLPMLTWVIEQGLPELLEKIHEWLSKIATVCEFIATEIALIKPLIELLKKDTGSGQGSWLQMIKEFFDWLAGDPLKNIKLFDYIDKFSRFINTIKNIASLIKMVLYGDFNDGRSSQEERKPKSFQETMEEIGEGIVIGIKIGMENAVKDNPFFKFVDKWIIKPIKKALDEHSPSKVMKEIGKNIVIGLLNGVKDKWPEFFEDWEKKCNSIAEKTQGLLESGQEALGNAWNAAKQKLGPVAPYIKNQFSIAYGGVTGVWGGLGSYFSNKSESVKSAFNGLDGALGGIFSATYHAMTKPFSNTEKDFGDVGKQVKQGLAYGANSNTILSESAGSLYKTTYANMIGAFAGTETDFNKIGSQVKHGLAYGADSNTILSEAARSQYTTTYTNMKNAFKDAQKDFNEIGGYIGDGISKGGQAAQTAMENLAKYVQGDFKTGMNAGFETSFSTFGSSVADSFESNIRKLIDAFNTSIRTMADRLNSTIAKLNSALGSSSGKSKGGSNIPPLNVSSVLIPKFLAQGAVLPPNKEFLAVLGDQHTGTNIETPLDTMIEAFRTALNEDGSSNHAPIVLQLNGKEVARAVWDEELKRYKQTGSWNPRLA